MSLQVLGKSFRHGIHPLEHKEETEHVAVERMPFVQRYTLPLRQHLGAPCKALVKIGDHVLRGQVIAEPGGFVSMTLHSPVTGKVSTIGPRRFPNGEMVQSIEIDADPYATQQFATLPPIDWEELSLDEFIKHVQKAGLVGMGGAAFPTHVKYKLPEGKRCQRFVVNGCECEPYLTCDHRLMVEDAVVVVRGTDIISKKLGADSATIGVEMNKPDAVVALNEVIKQGEYENITVVPLQVKYPQGAEKMLIKALFDEEVPAGKLPLDLNIVVNNVGTMAGIAEYFDLQEPFVERLVTVAGPGVERPSNLMVPIGIPVRDILQHCGLSRETRQVVMGGPMMGQPLASLDVPMLKGTSGLLAFTEEGVQHPTEYACVRCGQCLEACHSFLNPSRLARLARAERWDELEDNFLMDCVECGACTYTCPSNVPIVHLIRAAKMALREQKAPKS